VEISFIRLSNSVALGAISSYTGGPGLGLTKKPKFLERETLVLIMKGLKPFSRSSFMGTSGMYAYDYINRE